RHRRPGEGSAGTQWQGAAVAAAAAGLTAMRWDVFAWAALALVLFAAETIAPGAFMLWLGFAAVAVFLAVLLVPGIPVLAQVAAFIVLSFVSIQVYRTWFRGRERQSDRPALNRRTQALV